MCASLFIIHYWTLLSFSQPKKPSGNIKIVHIQTSGFEGEDCVNGEKMLYNTNIKVDISRFALAFI